MKKKALLLLTPFVLAGCNLLSGYGQPAKDDAMMEEDTLMEEDDAMMKEEDAMMEDGGEGAMMEGTAFSLQASNFTFGSEEIRVKQGDTVKITINNTQGTHDFNIDEFGVNSGIIPTGSSKTIEFTANKTGSFEYYCSVGNHRQLGMKGILVVE